MKEFIEFIYSLVMSQAITFGITMLLIIILGISNIRFKKIFDATFIFMKFIFHFFSFKSSFNRYYRKIRLKLDVYKFVNINKDEFFEDEIKFIIWDSKYGKNENYFGDIITFLFKVDSGKVIVNYKDKYNVFDLYEEIDYIEGDGDNRIFTRFLGECLLKFLKNNLNKESNLINFINHVEDKNHGDNTIITKIGNYMFDNFVVIEHKIDKCFKHHILNRLIFDKPIY